MGDFIPKREADLVTWTNQFSSLLTGSPVLYGVTIEEAADYQSLSDQFVAAYEVTQNNLTRSPSNIIDKDQKKLLMISNARLLARKIQGTPSVTPAMKSTLGLNPRITPREPIPAPDFEPELDVVSINGRTVTLRAHNGVMHRARPEGVATLTVLSFLGEEPPEGVQGWVLQSTSTKTVVEISFPPGEASTAWATAFWSNAKGQTGPACNPIQFNLAAGTFSLSEKSLKVAA